MTLCVCFKCRANYESDNEMDIAGDGYCPPCFELKTKIAKEVDAKVGAQLANSAKVRPLRLDELPTVNVHGMKFIPAKYFGL